MIEIVKPQKLHLIDPWTFCDKKEYEEAFFGGGARRGQQEMDERYKLVCDRFDEEIKAEIVEIHRIPSAEACQYFSDNYFDWVYIDGNHLYEFVKKDLESYFSKVKVGGLIVGDDCLEGHWWKGGVKKAVDEFIKAHPVEIVLLKKGQFILKRNI